MYDIIQKKRLGQALTRAEIRWLIDSYISDSVPDYQMSALAMAICLQGMTSAETAELTMAMAESGQVLDWSDIPGIKVDKHSTGGVGDTTTLVLGPLVAAAGVPVAKMSGRGLGHTGGTIDKLESIPGFRTDISTEAFHEQVRTIGIAIAAQTADLAPADKKLYALRDVTATVESIPLIASSIMSKKLASGADAIVLDVKVGDGAFMKDVAHARALAETMVAIARLAGRRAVAVLTTMEEPLGFAIGNALEVREAIATLRGQGPVDLTELCLTLGAEMVVQAGKAATAKEARSLLEEQMANGLAIDKFKAFVAAQGGDARVADDLSLLPKAPVVKSFVAPSDGVLVSLRAEAIGRVAMELGAGRRTQEDVIDPAVGVVLRRKMGQSVVRGEPLIEVHAASQAAADAALAALADCVVIGQRSPFERPLVLDIVRESRASVGDAVPAQRPETGELGDGSGIGVGDGADEGVGRDGTADLLQAAKDAWETAYVPYSRFAVGAALRLADGRIITGANIENASYGLTNCAERTAVFRALMENGGVPPTITGLAVIADSDGPVAPCGACRQVLAEFCPPDTPVLLADLQGQVKHTTTGELLPYAFGAAQMNGAAQETGSSASPHTES